MLRFDTAGACPVVVREDDELFSTDGAHWRLVAQTDDPAEAMRLVEELGRQGGPDDLALHASGGLSAAGGSGWESNPPLQGSARSRTALKAAQVTRPESLPRRPDDAAER